MYYKIVRVQLVITLGTKHAMIFSPFMQWTLSMFFLGCTKSWTVNKKFKKIFIFKPLFQAFS